MELIKQIKKGLITASLVTGLLGLAACQSTSQYLSDSSLTLKVKDELAKNHATHAADIHVDTDNGIVTLSGKVATERERQSANSTAKKVKGVKRVDNALALTKEVRH